MFLSVMRSSSSWCACSGSTVTTLMPGAFARPACAPEASRNVDVEVVLLDQRAGLRRAGRRRHVTVTARPPWAPAPPPRPPRPLGNSMRCCTSTGAEMRDAMPGKVARGRMAGRALAFAREVCLAGLRIAGHDVLHVEDVGPAQRVVDALPEEMHQVDDLGVGQPVLGLPLCIGCPFLRNGPSRLPYRSFRTTIDRMRLGAVSVPRADRPVAGDAFGGIQRRPRSAAAGSTGGRSGGPTNGLGRNRRRLRLAPGPALGKRPRRRAECEDAEADEHHGCASEVGHGQNSEFRSQNTEFGRSGARKEAQRRRERRGEVPDQRDERTSVSE